MISNLRYSIISIIELFRSRAKEWYQFNLLIFFIASLATIPVAMMAGYVLHYKLGVNIIREGDFFSDFLIIVQNEYLRPLSQGLIVLVAAVVSSYLFQVEFSEEKQQPSLVAFISYVPARVLKGFLAYAILLFIISIAVAWSSTNLKYAFDYDNYNSFSVQRHVYILNYILSLKKALLILLPYIFGFAIMLIYFEGHSNFEIIKKYRKPFFAIMILGFLSYVITHAVMNIVAIYVTSLFLIVSDEPVFISIIEFVMNLILASYFFLIYPSLFMYTVFYQFQNEQRLESARIKNENHNAEKNSEGELELDAQ